MGATSFVWSLSCKAKYSGGQVIFSECLSSFCLVKSRVFVHLAALSLGSMMLHYVTVNTVVLVGLTGMHKTGCSGQTRLVLAHHEPESIEIIIISARSLVQTTPAFTASHFEQCRGRSCNPFACCICLDLSSRALQTS